MSRYQYPHTIDNGAGERITFIGRVQGTNGERLEVENVVKPKAGPPMHTHNYQEEALTVVEGRIGYQRPGEEPQYAGPGATVSFKAGDAHKFWNAGDTDLRCVGYIEPADNIEFFLTELYASVARNGGHRPDIFDVTFLLHRYRSEFVLNEMPLFVRRFITPVQFAIGKMLGKFKKYDGSPEPFIR